MNTRNILITGGAGRLGSYVIKRLNKHNLTIVVLNDKEEKKNKDYNTIRLDLTNNAQMKSYRFDYDIVIHLAGSVDYTLQYEQLYKINVLGTHNLINNTMNVPMFIHTSSTSIYGKSVDNPVKELNRINLDSDYAKTKFLSEKKVLYRIRKDNQTIILRPSMLYGRGFHSGYFTMIDQIKKRKYKIIGDGENHIPILHADDAAQAFEKTVNKFGDAELMGLKLMNISCKPTPTQNELIKTVCDIIDAPMPKKHIPLWEAKLLAKLEEYYYKLKGERKPLQEYINKMASDRIFDISEAKRLIGYKPKVNIEQGIREVIDEYESIRTKSKNKKRTQGFK